MMTKVTSHYYNHIKQLKKLGSTNLMKIKINDTFAFLRPVDESDETIRLLTKWRNKYGNWYTTKFQATEVRTRKWLRSQVINNPDRILFMIILGNQKIGHIGIFRNREIDNTADIDNVLRAVRINYHRLMEKIIKSMFKWMFDELKLSRIQLRVFSDIYKAINLYEGCNMLTINTIPLKRVFTIDGWKWNKTKLKKGTNYAERYLNIMEITKESYQSMKRNPIRIIRTREKNSKGRVL